jgi:hypothetical protein
MVSRFKQVDLDDATAGMVLAADVLDHQGSVLLPQGAPLTEALLRSMHRRGIDSVPIVDDAVDPALVAAERARVEARLAQLFRQPGPGRADALLREQLTRYRLEELQ